MIITPRFIFVHFQKTGGNFVRKVLNQVCPGTPPGVISRYTKAFLLLCSNPQRRFRFTRNRERSIVFSENALPAGEKFPFLVCMLAKHNPQILSHFRWNHGSFHQLPDWFLSNREGQKPILLTVRNPFARYLSAYYYNTEINRTVPGRGLTRDMCSFREYLMEMQTRKFRRRCEEYFPGLERQHDIGFSSLQLIFFAAPNPREIMEMPTDEFTAFFKGGGYRDWFKRVRVLHMENLNHELHRFLLEMGYPAEKIEFILTQSMENTSPASKKKWQDFYDAELLRYVYEKDWVYFEMFPEYAPDSIGKPDGVAPVD